MHSAHSGSSHRQRRLLNLGGGRAKAAARARRLFDRRHLSAENSHRSVIAFFSFVGDAHIGGTEAFCGVRAIRVQSKRARGLCVMETHGASEVYRGQITVSDDEVNQRRRELRASNLFQCPSAFTTKNSDRERDMIPSWFQEHVEDDFSSPYIIRQLTH